MKQGLMLDEWNCNCPAIDSPFAIVQATVVDSGEPCSTRIAASKPSSSPVRQPGDGRDSESDTSVVAPPCSEAVSSSCCRSGRSYSVAASVPGSAATTCRGAGESTSSEATEVWCDVCWL